MEKFEYGLDFQQRIIALLLRDPNFLATYVDLIQPEYFSNFYLTKITDFIYQYFKTYREVPVKSTLETVIYHECSNLNLDQEIISNYAHYIGTIYNIDIENEAFVEDSVRLFCRKKEYNKSNRTTYELLQKGEVTEADMDAVSRIWIDTINKGYSSDNGIDLKSELHTIRERLTEEYSHQVRIPSGIQGLNHFLHGGYTKKGLHVWMAPPERGKTTALCSEACAFLRQGYTTHVYTAELTELQMLAKIITNITGMTTQEIMNPMYENAYQERIQYFLQYAPNIHIKYFRPNSHTANSILAHSSKLNLITGNKASVVMVDYFDKFLPMGGKKDNLYTDGGDIFQEFRNVAEMLDVAMIGACQPKGDAYEVPLLGMQHMSGSSQKSQIIDTLITINQNIDERNLMPPIVRLFNGKVRFGEAAKYSVKCELHYDKSYLHQVSSEQLKTVS